MTVLEGRNRLGGRLHQQRLSNGHLVDMGPNWIHGTKDNPILDLVRETGTITSNNATDEQGDELTGALFGQDGSILPLDDGTALSTLMWTIVEEAFVHSNKHCSEIDPAESLHDFFLQRLPEHIPDGTADCETRRTLVMQLADLWGAFVGSPVTTQSLKYFWLEECIEGGMLLLPQHVHNTSNRPEALTVSGREPVLCRDVQEGAREDGRGCETKSHNPLWPDGD